MFSPEVIARQEAKLLALPEVAAATGGRLRRRPVDECWAYRDQLADAVDKKGAVIRPLTPEENQFILHERLLAKIDYRYFSDRYAVVAKETQDAEPIHPRWKSQEIFLAQVGKLEAARQASGHPDGILINVLKGRQLGLSTETEVILAHRFLTQTAVRGLVAGDVPEQSKYLFGMAELVIEHCPWWLKPELKFHQAGSYIESTAGASLRVAAGKSQRGGLQDRGGAKGNIGRGKTHGLGHLSEISTWERPEQIRDGLEPGIPRRPRTFFVRESTAKGRNDFWHQEWRAADKGDGRWTNVFIPWYAEPEKYWLPAPEGWDPAGTTLAHADLVERTSAKFSLSGATIRLDREQLYWYERTRATFDEAENLSKFLEEYPAIPEEAFQHAGRSIFSTKLLDALRQQETRPAAIWHVEPAADIAKLRAMGGMG